MNQLGEEKVAKAIGALRSIRGLEMDATVEAATIRALNLLEAALPTA